MQLATIRNDAHRIRPGRLSRALGALVLATMLAMCPSPTAATTAVTNSTQLAENSLSASTPQTTFDIDVHPEKERPVTTSAEWPSYRGVGADNITSANAPTTMTGASWIRKLYERQGYTDMNGISEPILVGGKVFVAVSNQIMMLDPLTGETEKSATLANLIDSTCRVAYGDGVIIVPLDAGMLQAVTPDDLTTVWVTSPVEGDATDSDQQSLSTLTISDGFVYAGTSDAGKASGYLRRVSLADGSVSWSYSTGTSAYYWTGAATTPHGILVVQNSGELDLMSPEDEGGSGKVIASIQLASTASSTVVVSDGGSTAFVMGYDGTLYKVAVGSASLSLTGSAKLCQYSISTPTVTDGKVYVGGSTTSSMRRGALYVLDADTLEVLYIITGFDDGTSLQGPVASSPLVATHDDGIYVYFTANDGIGGAYVYRVGDDTARYLFVPSEELRQYTLSSVAVDSTGALYYINDSGNLFKLGGSAIPSSPIAASSSQDDTRQDRGSATQDTKAGATNNTQTTGDTASATEPASDPAEPPSTNQEARDGESGTHALGDSDDALPAGQEVVDDAVEDGGPDDSAQREERNLPIWPIVGMASGSIVAVLALLRQRGTLGRRHRKPHEG